MKRIPTNSDLNRLYERQMSELDEVIARIGSHEQRECNDFTNKTSPAPRISFSSNTTSEESVQGEATPDTSVTLDKDIESLFAE